MLSKLFKETTIYALGPQIPRIASFFILPIITKDLTGNDYGISALVYAYIGIVGAFKALGLTDIYINYFYKHPKLYKLIWRHFFGFLSSYSVVFGILQGLLIFLVLPLGYEERLIIVVLNIIPVILFDTTNEFGLRFLQLHHKVVSIFFISALSGLVVVFLNLYTISYLKLGYMGWFISAFIGIMTQFIFYGYTLYSNKIYPILRFRKKYLKKYLKISLPIVPNKYGHYLLNSSDRIVMNLIQISTINIGLYNFGYIVGNYSQILVTSLGIAIAPFYIDLLSKKKHVHINLAKNVTIFIQILFIIGTFTGALWLKELFSLLVSNKELENTYDIAIIILMMQNYAPLRFFYTNFVVFHEKTTFLWKITFVAGAINVISNFMLIPIYGIQIAAATTFITMFYISVVGFYYKQYRAIKKVKLYPILWFIISGIMTLLVYSLKNIEVEYKIYISLFSVSMIAFVIYFFRPLISNDSKMMNTDIISS